MTAGRINRELVDPESVKFILHWYIDSGAEWWGHLDTMLRENTGAECRRQKYYEMGDPRAHFGTLCGYSRFDCPAVDQNRERGQIWCKHSSGERAGIQFRKFPGGGEREVRHPYQTERVSLPCTWLAMRQVIRWRSNEMRSFFRSNTKPAHGWVRGSWVNAA